MICQPITSITSLEKESSCQKLDHSISLSMEDTCLKEVRNSSFNIEILIIMWCYYLISTYTHIDKLNL